MNLTVLMNSVNWDVDAAAAAAGVSRRTMYRRLSEAGLVSPRDLSERLVTHLRACGGNLDVGAAAVELYGADDRTTRQRVYTLLRRLEASGVVFKRARCVYEV